MAKRDLLPAWWRKLYPRLRLAEDEPVLMWTLATYQWAFGNAMGGYLWLTDRRLVWMPGWRLWWLAPERVAISLADITSIEMKPAPWWHKFAIQFWSIRIRTKDKAYLFSFPSSKSQRALADKWFDALRQSIQPNTDDPGSESNHAAPTVNG